MNFPRFLRSFRRSKKLSHLQTGKIAGMATATVVGLEQGKGSWASFLRLLKAFDFELQGEGYDGDIHGHVRILRAVRGKTGASVCKSSRISRHSLSRLEKGDVSPSFSAVIRILRNLKSDLHIVQARQDYALEGDESETVPPILNLEDVTDKPINDISNSIIHGDCVDVMQELPAESVHMAVTSPPYQNLRTYRTFDFDFEAIAKSLYRVMVTGGVVCWVVGDSVNKPVGTMHLTPFRHAIGFEDAGFSIHDIIIWQKDAVAFPATANAKRHTAIHEYVLVLSKGKPRHISLLRDKPNLTAGTKNFGKNTDRRGSGVLISKPDIKEVEPFSPRTSIWRIATGGAGKTAKNGIAHDHPAIFPERLAEDLIKTYSVDGDVILDPMAGSCTTAIAARRLGRRYVMIELADDYCQLGRKRLAAGVSK